MWCICCKADLNVTVLLNVTLPIGPSVATLCSCDLSHRQSDGTFASSLVRFLIYRIYQFRNIFLLHPDLLKYRKELFKINFFFFRKLMIRHWWQSPLFLLIPSLKIVLTKMPEVKNWCCWLKQRPGEKSTHFVYFPAPPLQAELSVSEYCSSRTRARNLWLINYTLVEVCWSPKGITWRQTLGSQNFEKRLLASSYLSVCLSTGFRGIARLPLDGFSRNLIFECFSKIC